MGKKKTTEFSLMHPWKKKRGRQITQDKAKETEVTGEGKSCHRSSSVKNVDREVETRCVTTKGVRSFPFCKRRLNEGRRGGRERVGLENPKGPPPDTDSP